MDGVPKKAGERRTAPDPCFLAARQSATCGQCTACFGKARRCGGIGRTRTQCGCQHDDFAQNFHCNSPVKTMLNYAGAPVRGGGKSGFNPIEVNILIDSEMLGLLTRSTRTDTLSAIVTAEQMRLHNDASNRHWRPAGSQQSAHSLFTGLPVAYAPDAAIGTEVAIKTQRKKAFTQCIKSISLTWTIRLQRFTTKHKIFGAEDLS